MFNRFWIIGNMVTDIAVKQTSASADSSVGNFRIASNRKYKDKEEQCFLDVVVWGKQADNCAKYLSKGSRIAIDGRLVTKTWDSESGKRSKIELVAERVIFLNSKGESSGSGVPEEHSTLEPF